MQPQPSGLFSMNFKNSLALKCVSGLFLIVMLTLGTAVAARPADGTNELAHTIQYLLDFVKKSDCQFYRNNKQHTAGEAATHMQKKYEHFRDEIKTPEDFIRLAATKSLISGKPYYVKLKTGEKITSEAWLLKALEAYREKQK